MDRELRQRLDLVEPLRGRVGREDRALVDNRLSTSRAFMSASGRLG